MLCRHVHDPDGQPGGEVRHVAHSSPGSYQQYESAGHQCRPHELIRAALLVIAIDEHQARPNAHQRAPGGFLSRGKVGMMSPQFDGGSQ